ncbi:hypothetical protein OHT59_04655 [Streptomyces sp. NBC_00243]|uniref:hypothetical protein n=1 Tax=Streptomyces sp. NBC_00243 TaxID=2975688 RepID=UPI002DDAE77B|nr:hypothetical protein [Streptomyces sp. NBC_00243]WRZ17826.1 hypothetical protein OHT59_04655 [Streptomyces sp. NBC_00243]
MPDTPDDPMEEDSYIDLPVRAVFGMRWAAVHGRHRIPTIGTLVHRKRWYSRRVCVRYLPVGEARSRVFTTDWETLVEIIEAGSLPEARTLISLCLTDAEP